MKKKIDTFSDLSKKIRELNSEYLSKLDKRYESKAFFLRVVTARALWFYVLYQVSTMFFNLSVSLSGFAIFILIGSIVDVFLQAFSDDIPPWFNYIYKGEFLCDLSLGMLNLSIFLLAILGCLMHIIAKFYTIPLSIKRINSKL